MNDFPQGISSTTVMIAPRKTRSDHFIAWVGVHLNVLHSYPIHYLEFSGGHSTIIWRGTLADGLLVLFDKGADEDAKPERDVV